MNLIALSDLSTRELFAGVQARLVHTDHVTIAHVEIKKGAVVPAHSHVHEQTINFLEGSYELTIENNTKVISAPCVCVVPSNAQHAVTAITDGKIIDVFSPVREDLK